MSQVIDWLKKLGREYRERVAQTYKDLSGEELDEFLGGENDDA